MTSLAEPLLEVRTPDGVVLRQPLAGAGSRALAGLLDLVLVGTLALLLALAALALASLDSSGVGGFVAGLVAGGVLLVFVLYRIVFELAWSGRTPGKRLCGLRVVQQDGRPAGALPTVLRGLFWPIDLTPLPLPLGLALIFATPRQQRIGDLVAGTVVVREPAPPPPEPWPEQRWSELSDRRLALEPGLAARLAPADLAFLRELVTRQSLAPERRRALYVRSARHYAERLGLGEFEDARVLLRELYLFAREQLELRDR